jgi:hypothetical protein
VLKISREIWTGEYNSTVRSRQNHDTINTRPKASLEGDRCPRYCFPSGDVYLVHDLQLFLQCHGYVKLSWGIWTGAIDENLVFVREKGTVVAISR